MISPSVVVGTDLVRVGQIAESIERFGARFLERIFTPGELDDCLANAATAPMRLAARFAAKEATRKVLLKGDEPLGWRSIEIARRPNGAPEVVLHREAKALAARAGLFALSLSMSHEADYASAVVVGERARGAAAATVRSFAFARRASRHGAGHRDRLSHRIKGTGK